MKRLALAAMLIASCTSCSDGNEAVAPIVANSTDVSAGPAPEGTIVDLPMDAISNQDMADEGGDAPIEGQIVESDR